MIESHKLTKLYYTIGEVADMFHVNTSLIRFWEKEFAIIQPKKNKKGNRLFTPKDIKNFARIYDLVKVNGYTLEGAKKALKSKNNDVEQVKNDGMSNAQDENEVIHRLEEIRTRLLKLKE